MTDKIILRQNLTVNCHSEYEEWHAVELPASPDAEAEASLASLELQGEVLVGLVLLLHQVTMDLVILLGIEIS